jgi:glycosyltransferase involved in cell wall biosynthesis
MPKTDPIEITKQHWSLDAKPLVSVCNWVYNHKDFIEQSIDSILMQKTTFPVEIIIQDDASNDGTREIIEEYAFRYPHLFKNILFKENQYSQGKDITIGLFKKASGKYIALAHGDDYWTDPYKLQKQVDFLEANKGYGLVYTNFQKLINREIIRNEIKFHDYLDLESYFQYGLTFLFTGSWLIRNDLGSLTFLDTKFGSLPGDVQIICYVLTFGNRIHFLDQITGVYRVLNESASHSLVTNKDKDFALVRYLLLMKYKNNISKHTFTEQLEKLIQSKFQYFGSFKLGLIDRIGLFMKLAKIKGVNRASRFIIYNVS